MIETTLGLIDEALLTKVITSQEIKGNVLVATEYSLDGAIVHRSIDIMLSPQSFLIEQTPLG